MLKKNLCTIQLFTTKRRRINKKRIAEHATMYHRDKPLKTRMKSNEKFFDLNKNKT